MTGQLVVGALTSIAAMGLFAALLQRSASSAPHVPRRPASSALARAVNDARPDGDSRRWAVVRAASAHEALVLEVETLDVERALEIAREVVEPVSARYREVLVYLRPAGSTTTSRRVQWTPDGGYKELIYAPGPS